MFPLPLVVVEVLAFAVDERRKTFLKEIRLLALPPLVLVEQDVSAISMECVDEGSRRGFLLMVIVDLLHP